MTSNDSPISIYAKLAAARKEFHQIPLVKTGHNTFAGYKYFELSDFLIPAMDCMHKHGLVPVVSFSMEYASMTIHEIDGGGNIVITSPMSTARLKACHEVQNLGAVETYERRYLWIAAMEIVENDPAEVAKPESVKATPEQIAVMFDYAEAGAMTDGQVAWLKTAGDRITEDQAAYVLEKLREAENDNAV